MKAIIFIVAMATGAFGALQSAYALDCNSYDGYCKSVETYNSNTRCLQIVVPYTGLCTPVSGKTYRCLVGGTYTVGYCE
jgi:hypothetical protein